VVPLISQYDVAQLNLTHRLDRPGGGRAPTPTWGNLLNDARGLIKNSPGLTWFPGLAIFLSLLCVNFFGDGLPEALDPHKKLGALG
jgi:ABC-type antimicrobial peptide transport system permease subunit